MGGETRQARTGLLVWSYREDFARSLCDERGVALTPGFFTGVRGTRSQTRALQMAREAARRAGSPLFAYMAEVTLSFPADVPPAEISRGRHDNTFPWQLVDAGQGHMLRTLRDRVVRAVDPSFPTGPRALENLIGRSPALFFRRFFSCPLFSAVRMVSWTLPKDHGGWSGLHLATVLTPAITGISLLSPSRDLLAGLEGVERRRRLGYRLGTSLSPGESNPNKFS